MDDSALDTRLSALCAFENAVQVFAVWSDNKRSGEENYLDFFAVMENLEREAEKNSGKCVICRCRDDLLCDGEKAKAKVKLIPAVEGAALLCGDISRLRVLYGRGVRILTFAWRGVNEACGAHDTDVGLTDFGKSLLRECEKLKIIADVSHMSERAFWDTVSAAERPVVASHSNSAQMCAHARNLTDNQFRTVSEMGGLVGMNLYLPFLSRRFENSNCVFDTDEYFSSFCAHIEHFLSLGGEKCICLGGDRDGFDRVDGYSQLEFIDRVYDKLIKNGIKEKIIKDIFSGNARRFFESAIG